MEKQPIQLFLVTIDQRVQFTGAGEYQMVVVNVKHMLILRVDPEFIGQCLTHRAGPVTTGIVMELNVAALAASGNIHPVCPCLTV